MKKPRDFDTWTWILIAVFAINLVFLLTGGGVLNFVLVLLSGYFAWDQIK